MDSGSGNTKNNPFFNWAQKYGKANLVVYVPGVKVVPVVLAKWNLSKSALDIAETRATREQFEIRRTLVEYWSNPTISYNAEKKVATMGRTIFPVVEEVFGPRGLIFRFVKGWIATPELTTYLVRLLKQDSGNEGNPFRKLVSKIKGNEYLPDILYLPKLYEELGVSSFEELNISETGDWQKIWEGVGATIGELKALFVNKNIPILWTEKATKFWYTRYYLYGLPDIVMDRLREVVIHNRAPEKPLKWTKDTFQAMTKKLKGKDIVALCISSTSFGQLCQANNQLIFRNKLVEEFGVDYNQNDHGFESPMLLYKQMHIYYEYVYLEGYMGREEGDEPIYVLNSVVNGVKSQRQTSPPLAILVPPPDMYKKVSYVINYVVFFPSAPELSFYVSFFPKEIGTPSLKGLHESKSIEKVLSNADLMNKLVLPIINIYVDVGAKRVVKENNNLGIDLFWLEDPEDVHILRSSY